ncbi:MAG: EAL domain-containing protein [Campylobacterota bacterium]|nr:EAL domain-containing protein [Campylobacterota bacterium]
MNKFCKTTSLVLAFILVVTSTLILSSTPFSTYSILYLTVVLLSFAFIGASFVSKKDKRTEDYNLELQNIAFQDSLTSLLNRRAVEILIDKIIARSKRNNSKFAILYLDLDNFKPINDTLGHDIGDKVLIEVATRLKKLIRENDAVGRIGGDEFIMLLDAISEPEQTSIMSERIVKSFNTPFVIDGHSISMSFSIGISIYPDNGEYRIGLFKAADAAMYQAKERGKNCYKFYTDELDKKVKKNIILDNALKQALENEEFMLVYQPRINLQDSNVKEAEALIRWSQPGRGIVMPSQFIDRAEKNGLIVEIGAWVIDRVCYQCKKYCDDGMPTQISINISVVQLKDDRLISTVKNAIEKYGIKASLIELEVSESILIQDAQLLIPILSELKNLGIQLAVDEFGKGYSSMGYLKRLPIDKIKIDKSLINEIIINQKDKELVSAMSTLGRVMGLSVVAEGVEIDKHLEVSKSLDIESAQGYLFTEALLADELYDFYKTFNTEVA